MELNRNSHGSRSRASPSGSRPRRIAFIAAACLFVVVAAGLLAEKAMLRSRSGDASSVQAAIAALAARLDALEMRLEARETHARKRGASGSVDGAGVDAGRTEGVSASNGDARPWASDVTRLEREIRALRLRLGAELLGGVTLAGELPDSFDLSQLEELEARDAASNEAALPYSAEQVAGEPDARTSGDSSRSWCPGEADAGEEWIDVSFAHRATPLAVIVREHYTPGAVARIDATDARGRSRTIWEGDDPTRSNPGNFVVFIDSPFPTSQVRVWLDTSRRQGWTEVDAVGLLTADGMLWTATARASSTWSSGSAPAKDAELGRAGFLDSFGLHNTQRTAGFMSGDAAPGELKESGAKQE